MHRMSNSVSEVLKPDNMRNMPRKILFILGNKLHFKLPFTVYWNKQDLLKMQFAMQDMRGLDNKMFIVRTRLLFLQLNK
jgi:hypothetical protein